MLFDTSKVRQSFPLPWEMETNAQRQQRWQEVDAQAKRLAASQGVRSLGDGWWGTLTTAASSAASTREVFGEYYGPLLGCCGHYWQIAEIPAQCPRCHEVYFRELAVGRAKPAGAGAPGGSP